MAKVYVALGANLADPVQQLDDACNSLKRLAKTDSFMISPYYGSVPMGEVVQPDYTNAVCGFETELDPIELLDALQAIENKQGRERTVRWGARTLDLDLLLYDDLILKSERLTIPHYGMKQRSFVLIPLHDIAADLILPCGEKLADLINGKLTAELRPISK